MSRFVEPTSLLPLRWGTHRGRLAAGLALIVAGTVDLPSATGRDPWPLLIGAAAVAVGWSILPADGWRRVLAAIVGAGQVYLLLSGPQAMFTFVAPYLCWLLVRRRPLLSYLTVVFPALNGLMAAALFAEFSGMLPALSITAVVLVASAACARLLARLSGMGRVSQEGPNSMAGE